MASCLGLISPSVLALEISRVLLNFSYHGSRNDHLQQHRPEPQFQLIDQHQLYQRQQLAAYELLHGHGQPGLGVEPQTFAPASTGVALDLEDNAIVCFGESFSDLNLADISSLQASDSGIEQVRTR